MQEENKKKCGKQVPQLGEQEAQSIAPLKVLSDKASALSRMGSGDYAIADVVYKYTPGEPLVEDTSVLTTQLWDLHHWYMEAAKEKKTCFMAKVQQQHYFEDYGVEVAFSDLFQMYNQHALDKSIISCYCL